MEAACSSLMKISSNPFKVDTIWLLWLRWHCCMRTKSIVARLSWGFFNIAVDAELWEWLCDTNDWMREKVSIKDNHVGPLLADARICVAQRMHLRFLSPSSLLSPSTHTVSKISSIFTSNNDILHTLSWLKHFFVFVCECVKWLYFSCEYMCDDELFSNFLCSVVCIGAKGYTVYDHSSTTCALYAACAAKPTYGYCWCVDSGQDLTMPRLRLRSTVTLFPFYANVSQNLVICIPMDGSNIHSKEADR
jgi:hypothetical protein